MDRIAKVYFANTDSQGLAKLCRFHASQALAESNKAFYTEIADVLEQQQAEIERLKPLAALGELAVEAMKIDSSNFRCNGLVGIEDNSDGIEVCSMGDYEEGCPWQDFCVKRAEMRGECGE